MKSKTLHRTIPTLVLSAAAAVPGGSALAATSHASSTKAQVFKGPLVDMRWGPVQATITVKHKKITKVGVLVTPETSRSQFIDDQAVPMLKTEVLQAQSDNIDGVSGATDTSDAFTQSLTAAIAKAKAHKALK